MAGVLRRAVKDLSDPDPLKALDAFCFWIDGDAQIYLEALDLPTEPFAVIVRLGVIEDGRYLNQIDDTGASIRNRNRQAGREANPQVSARTEADLALVY